ncbi:coiled-coil domain-containing protein [Flavobacterium subsaxonicum]|uniref:Uncharacterized protein n=1 Tax=Flavobacterium subsaxonicum WB 4.1-42 = DSM 21790 TaxID=1121898 RepID=A0A0A2MJV5_9FLAO|nr:hypothetical protein [Flavobacterium subsaxonicum]KGO91743.1 hypothetical protein Q766_15995 [Flavobacterium subsaxonicum WB 4.1-42 = DSM 21790]
MAKQKIVLAQLDLDVKGLIKATEESEKAIKKLKNRMAELQDAGQETSAGFASLQQQLERLTDALEDQQDAVKELRKKNEDLADAQKDTAKATKKQTEAHNDLSDSLDAATSAATGLKAAVSSTATQVAGLGTAAVTSATGVEQLNQSLTTQAALNAQVSEANTKGIKTFNDYKDQVAESFNSINILNGGLGGLISRAQEAGGAGPLLKNAFDGMASGIGGMTKSSLAFMATPIGAVLAVIGLAVSALVSYFKDSQEGMDKLTAVTRPLQSVFSALNVVLQNVGKYLSDLFTDPVESLKKFGNFVQENVVNRFMGMAELLPNLGKAIGLLFEGEFGKAGKVAADAVGKVAIGTENITDKVAGAAKQTSAFLQDAWQRGQQIDQLQKQLDKSLADYTKTHSSLGIELEKQNTIADDTNATFAQRETAAKKALTTQQEQNKLALARMDTEIKILDLKLQENGVTDAEKVQLAELKAKRDETAAQYTAGEKVLHDKIGGIRQEANDTEKARRQQLLDDALAKQKQQLDLFIAQGSAKSKTLQQEIDFENSKAAQTIAILDKELKAKKITREQYDKEKLNTEQQQLKAIADATAAYAQAELDLYVQNNANKLEGEKLLTAELVKAENDRLEKIKIEKLKILDIETGISQQSIEEKRRLNQQLTTEDLAYLTQKAATETEFKNQMKENDEALEAQVKAQKTAQAQADKDIAVANAQTQYDADILLEQQRFAAELETLQEQYDSKLLTKKQYDTMVDQATERSADNQEKIEQAKNTAVASQYATLFGNVSQLLGKKTAAGKAAAIAEATMNTYNGVTQVWASDSILPEPAATIAKVASTALVVASGLSAVKKITSTKAPKAAKGALFNIGGNRHSNGGTMFTGADGTRFEAEQGELIGVMNRNAAAHFMAFNNAFPAGGSSGTPNYFASGGIVSREMTQPGLNVDELAAKIAVANAALPAPVVAVQDIITQGNSYVQVRDAANF